MIIFGVDSIAPASTRLKNGYTLFDWVMRQNSFPAFWGHSLTGENAVTQEEIVFLQSKRCAIALIVRDLTEASVSSPDGEQDALRAVKAAKELNVPQDAGIVLFAYIHPDWSVNHNWMIDFAQTLYSNGYLPGFIGNTDSSKNFNFDRQCSHYVQATQDMEQFHAVYWATEPKIEGEPNDWTPYCPSALQPEDIGLWQNGCIRFDNLEVDVTYARDETLLESMWKPNVEEEVTAE